jgi:hypothetical protein
MSHDTNQARSPSWLIERQSRVTSGRAPIRTPDPLQSHSRVWDGLIFSRRGSPEQHATGINPIIIRAFYSAGAHHPHLQGGTLGDWPLNLFDEKQAAAELPTLRSIASADIHNLVFQRDYRIIPAIVSGRPP